jgi:glycosyltransferase involved in cell wall biosynthesis
MKILHLNTLTRGGAANAARRLHQGLCEIGIGSAFGCAPGYGTHWASSCGSPTPRWKPIEVIHRRISFYQYKRRLGGIVAVTVNSHPRTRILPVHLASLLPADVINLHWIANFLDWEACLPWLAAQAPLVWTLHDMNPFSGIWHYTPNQSERTKGMLALDEQVLKIKRQVLASLPKDRLTFVAPSKWMAKEAEDSELLSGFPVRHIPNGLNTESFRPINKSTARAALGLDEENKIIGFISDGASDPRKGLSKLIEALEGLPSHSQPHLVIAGGNYTGLSNYRITDLGRIESDEVLRLFYSCLDLFVCPSLQDNLPNTILESFACGTPVVAFDAGGIPEMVRPSVSGWLAKTGVASELRARIQDALLDSVKLSDYSSRCRDITISEYPLSVQACRYKDLYESILEPS